MQHEVDAGRQALPLRDFGLELLAARLRQRVEARAAVVLRRAPFGRDPALVFEPVDRGIERALLDPQQVI